MQVLEKVRHGMHRTAGIMLFVTIFNKMESLVRIKTKKRKKETLEVAV